MTNTEQKFKKRDTNYEKLVLIFQTLFGEEVIKKGTYDKLHGLLKEMQDNQPTGDDLLIDLMNKCEKTRVHSSQTTTTAPEYELTQRIRIQGKLYYLTLKQI